MLKKWLCLLICVLLAGSALAAEVKEISVGEDPGFAPDAPLLEVYFFDVYATDSILLRCGGETMLVDCGDTNYGRAYIAPRLRELGVERINYAVNTHPHDDHLNGFNTLLDEIPVDVFYTFFPPDACAEQKAFYKTAEKHGLPIIEATDEAELSFGGCTITLYQDTDRRSMNCCSLVMHVKYGDCAVILMADNEPDAHRRMAAKLGESLRADIIKMPHHGINSVASDAWNYIQPTFAVITNRINDKTRKTYNNIRSKGARGYFTINGYVECLTDGTRWTVRQYKKW